MPPVLKLSDLPLEILIAILEESGWREVLRLRKVRFKSSMWHVSGVFTQDSPELHGALRSFESSEHLVEPLSRLPHFHLLQLPRFCTSNALFGCTTLKNWSSSSCAYREQKLGGKETITPLPEAERLLQPIRLLVCGSWRGGGGYWLCRKLALLPTLTSIPRSSLRLFSSRTRFKLTTPRLWFEEISD